MTKKVGGFPISTGSVKPAYIAIDGNRKIFGVTITIGVKTEDVKDLPEPFKSMAQNVLYYEAVKNEP